MSVAEPKPESFIDLGLSPELCRPLEERGYTKPTPIQVRAIPAILEGRDVIGSAQTGTGKTAAFALPILQRLKPGEPSSCLVLGPTRELVCQVAENFEYYGKETGLKQALIYGGVGFGKQISDIKNGAEILAATPGRLLDLAEQRKVDLSKVKYLILDEFDRLLDMGFIEEVQRIIRKIPKTRQTLLFSATLSDDVRRLAKMFLKDPVRIEIEIKIRAADTVDHAIYPVDPVQKFSLLFQWLESVKPGSMIIFCRTKAGADQITKWFRNHEFQVVVMHSNLSQKERTEGLADFKSGKKPILIATDIASRGLDIANVTHVVNFEVPQHPEDYVHRIGRTGRAQREGSAITLMSPDELSAVNAIEKLLGQTIPRRTLEGFDYWHPPMVETTPPPARKKRNRGFGSGSRRF